jgi:predicted nucleic acid-binding protein
VIVLDASAVIEILLCTPLGIRHTDRVLGGEETLHAPHLIDVEALQVLRRLTLAKELDAQRTAQALVTLIDLPLVRHDHTPLIGRIWALRTSVTAYDAAYIALAEALPAILLTCDGKLARAHGHHARVELLT